MVAILDLEELWFKISKQLEDQTQTWYYVKYCNYNSNIRNDKLLRNYLK